MSETKHKQVVYSTLFKRVIATMMDMLIVSTIFAPIASIFSKWFFFRKFGSILKEKNIDITDAIAVMEVFKNPDMAQYNTLSNMLDLLIPISLFQIVTLGLYCIGSWYYIGATPVKYVLGMKVVDQDSLQRPKLINLIWRFLGYSLFMIGIWSIMFTKKKQALHDKLGRTVVIKA